MPPGPLGYVAGGGGAAMTSTRWPPGISANARGSPHSSRDSSTSKPPSRSLVSVASKPSGATTAGWPSGGLLASGVWMKWIWPAPRSSHVTYSAISSGAGTRSNERLEEANRALDVLGPYLERDVV